MDFAGYSADLIPFLEALPGKDPAWFKANKSTYDEVVVKPTKALVVEMGDILRVELPDIAAVPRTNGSIAPINNDLRFSPDKTPYKDHLLLRFWEGETKKSAPTLFVRIASEGIGFAAGVVPSDVERWRSAIASPAGAEFDSLVVGLTKSLGADVVGQELKRVPAPYAADHDRGELLRHKMIQVRWQQAVPACITDGSFSDWCVEQLQPAVPLHRWLVQHL